MNPSRSGSVALVMTTTLLTAIASSLQRPCKAPAEVGPSAGPRGAGRSSEDVMALDEAKLNEMLHQFVVDLGATIAAGGVVLGDRLGLYKALAEKPATAAELAQRTGTQERYVTEWARGQAA